ncbi:MAG: NAD-dependent epimerase/dehydratase family protein [Actinobacteria bacterium]|nr:NAD-dependent epimerase/dehydratase family protein [Actinomycetota bacterium]
MRYVVTGAAGFIGSHLAEGLIDAGHEVVGADCFTDYYDPRLKQESASRLDVVRIDLAEEPLDDLLAGADGVFHLAGQPGVRSFGDVFPDYVRRNLVASQRVFEAAAARGCRVVFSSSSSIYGDAERLPTPETTEPRPLSPYGITKLGCEHLARAYGTSFGLDVVVLRYFTVYGPRQRPDMAFARLVGALAEGRTFELYGDGSASRGFTYVGDVVTATIAAMERGRGGATMNVGGGAEATMLEAIALLESISGRRLDLRVGAPAAGDVRRTAADTSLIGAELGWHPAVSLEEGLRAQWEWASSRVAAR